MTKAEKTRQYIIERTAPVFNKKGITGTTMSEITGATGLTKGSVYGNFKNKNELALEAFKYNYNLLRQEIQQELTTKNSAIEKLFVFTRFYLNNYRLVFERGGCVLLNTATDSDDQHHILLSEVKNALQGWKNTLEKIVEEGIQNGEMKPIDPDEFASFFIAVIEGSIFLSKTTNSYLPIEKNIRRLEKEIDSNRI